MESNKRENISQSDIRSFIFGVEERLVHHLGIMKEHFDDKFAIVAESFTSVFESIDGLKKEVGEIKIRQDMDFATLSIDITEMKENDKREFERIDKRFERVDKRFEKLEKRFEKRFDEQDQRFDILEEKLESVLA